MYGQGTDFPSFMRGDVLTYNIVVITEDHIGPKLTVASKAALEAVQNAEGGFRRYLKTCIAGAAHYAKNGTAMTPEGIKAGSLSAFFGADSTYTPPSSPSNSIRTLPPRFIATSRAGIDYVIVRENTEGSQCIKRQGQ